MVGYETYNVRWCNLYTVNGRVVLWIETKNAQTACQFNYPNMTLAQRSDERCTHNIFADRKCSDFATFVVVRWWSLDGRRSIYLSHANLWSIGVVLGTSYSFSKYATNRLPVPLPLTFLSLLRAFKSFPINFVHVRSCVTSYFGAH